MNGKIVYNYGFKSRHAYEKYLDDANRKHREYLLNGKPIRNKKKRFNREQKIKAYSLRLDEVIERMNNETTASINHSI